MNKCIIYKFIILIISKITYAQESNLNDTLELKTSNLFIKYLKIKFILNEC